MWRSVFVAAVWQLAFLPRLLSVAVLWQFTLLNSDVLKHSYAPLSFSYWQINTHLKLESANLFQIFLSFTTAPSVIFKALMNHLSYAWKILNLRVSQEYLHNTGLWWCAGSEGHMNRGAQSLLCSLSHSSLSCSAHCEDKEKICNSRRNHKKYK